MNSVATVFTTLAGELNTSAGSNTATLTAGAVGRADVGRVFNGTTGVPHTVLSAAPGGESATLSTRNHLAPARDGAYDLVVGSTGAPDAPN